MTDANKPDAQRGKLTAITDMLAKRDNAALLALLDDNGGDANWCDDRGQTLLHFAALRGDEELCEALVCKKGFSALIRNEDGDTPARIAAIFGHERLAEHLFEIERAQRAILATPVIGSLSALRNQTPSIKGASMQGGMFYHYACNNHFAAVVDAALKSGESFTREDLLTAGQKGESVALRLCQSGQLPLLLRADLWRTPQQQDVLRAVRDSLPRDFRAQIDAADILPKAGMTGPAGGVQGPAGPANDRRYKLGPK